MIKEPPSPADASKTETKNAEKILPSPESENVTASGESKKDSEPVKIDDDPNKEEKKTEEKAKVPPPEPGRVAYLLITFILLLIYYCH